MYIKTFVILIFCSVPILLIGQQTEKPESASLRVPRRVGWALDYDPAKHAQSLRDHLPKPTGEGKSPAKTAATTASAKHILAAGVLFDSDPASSASTSDGVELEDLHVLSHPSTTESSLEFDPAKAIDRAEGFFMMDTTSAVPDPSYDTLGLGAEDRKTFFTPARKYLIITAAVITVVSIAAFGYYLFLQHKKGKKQQPQSM